MVWQHCIMDIFLRIAHDLAQVLEGLTVEELHHQPGPASNSIGWLAWHLTRSHDRNISELAGQDQLWITEGWYVKFSRAPDPTETGVGHSAAEATAFRAPDCRVLLDYHHAVVERIRHYVLRTLSEEELDREVDSPTLRQTATVQRRLVGIISEGLQHVGQAAYGRGLLQGHGWLGR
jgi:DinB superfamily